MTVVTRPDYPTVRQWMDYKRHLAELKAELERKAKLFAVRSAETIEDKMRSLTVESHRIIAGEPSVRLSRYGWFVVGFIGGTIAVWSAALAIGLPGLLR